MPSEAPETRTPVRLVGFAALTVGAAVVGRSTTDDALGISLVWPLYGVAVLWIASGDRRTHLLDSVALAAFTGAAIWAQDRAWPLALLAMVLVNVVAWTWVWVARWIAPGRPALARPRSLADLSVVLAATAAAALLGAVVRTWGMGLLPTYDLETFLLLLIRNASGILGPVALGVLLVPYAGPDGRRRLRTAVGRWVDRPMRRVGEVMLMAGTGLALTAQVFAEEPQPFAFALVLVVVWAAFRLPPVGAVLYAVVLGLLGVVATFVGRGAFVTVDAFESAAVAQAFLITLVLAALAIAIDVEERRTATERARLAEREAEGRATLFSTVIEHLDEGVTVITSDDSYSVRNRAARRLTGLGGFLDPEPGDGTQPCIVDETGVPVPASQLPHARARAEERLVRETVRVRLPSGARRHLEISSIPVPGVGDDPRPVVVNTVRDVTAEHEERDQLVAFAGVVAHDLKNPLTVIRGWSESLQEELAADGPPDVGTLRSMVDRVHAASDQMRVFIDDLLGITVARDRPLQPETLDLSALAEEVAELRRGGDARPRITVQPGMRVTGDRFLVRQLLDNLLGNAVKYVAPGIRPAVTVTAAVADDELEVSVTDNGIGIPREQHERVFDSFVRVHDAGYSGTGLGLAICSRVVARHGGRIWVAETTAPGTRISFTLPLPDGVR